MTDDVYFAIMWAIEMLQALHPAPDTPDYQLLVDLTFSVKAFEEAEIQEERDKHEQGENAP